HFFGQRPLLWHFLDMATLETNGASNAVYKRWIPNTNFENSSNWDQGRVPCATDAILFESSKVLDLKFIPLNGEFILAPGAGFAAFDSRSNPGCDTGTVLSAATSLDNLEQGKLMFSVDEERVPCQYDDAIFQPETSFRVNIESPEQMIQLKSISIMGQKFTSDSTLAEYMQSLSGKLQFHGQGRFQLSNSRCPDKSGCQCGNAASHDRICTALLQKTGNRCPTVVCKGPLKPVGHCCEICEAQSPGLACGIWASGQPACFVMVAATLTLRELSDVRVFCTQESVFCPQLQMHLGKILVRSRVARQGRSSMA
uniref:Protein amnionless n=1 Tax=Varanus komodoensis TaxID=61221 RepID=A0A8D2JBR1_VARKO